MATCSFRVRGKGSGRKDDQDVHTINVRLDTYRAQSEPCIAHYKETNVTVHEIDGVGSIDEITQRILGALGVSP